MADDLHFRYFRDYRTLGDFKWVWPHFTPYEMADRGTGALLVVPSFMDWLESVRGPYNRAMPVNSGYREGDPRSHGDGMAVDIGVSGVNAESLERIALANGVLGRGICQSPDLPHHKRYLHLDLWTKAPVGTRPMLWSY